MEAAPKGRIWLIFLGRPIPFPENPSVRESRQMSDHSGGNDMTHPEEMQRAPAQALGQDTDRVLMEILGYSADAVAQMREKGIIG